jgi:hypothetical protein
MMTRTIIEEFDQTGKLIKRTTTEEIQQLAPFPWPQPYIWPQPITYPQPEPMGPYWWQSPFICGTTTSATTNNDYQVYS